MSNIIDLANLSAISTDTPPIITDEPYKRYTVEKAYIPLKKGEHNTKFVILEDGIPEINISRFLLTHTKNRADPSSTLAYCIARFLNEMNDMSLSLSAVSLGDISDYYTDMYISEAKSYQSIVVEIDGLAALCEHLAVRQYPLDDTILRSKSEQVIVIKSGKEKRKLTWVSLLKDSFIPRNGDINKYLSQSYTKWYTGPQIQAISTFLVLMYRCIFYLTVFAGYRADTALSVLFKDVDFAKGIIRPTRTKTKQWHYSVLPQFLVDMLMTYAIEIRNEIIAKTGSKSPYFFLNSKGTPVTYAAYNQALKAAGEKVMAVQPDLGLDVLHTHAGRSTYAAALRSYQLDQLRTGKGRALSDKDFCLLMDWKNMGSLRNYDILTRTLEISPLLTDFYKDFYDLASSNQISILNNK